MAFVPDILPADDRWLSRLPGATAAFIRDHVRRRRYPDLATVYASGDDGDGLYQVISGEVRLISYPTIGRQTLTMIMRRRHWFGELSVVDGGPRPHDAICHGDVMLLHLPMRDIKAFAEQDPSVFGQIALIGCAHQRAALSFIGTLLAKPSKTRLAEMILAMLPHGAGRTESPTMLEISQEDLAGRIGISRQHLNTLLADIKRGGSISTSYGGICVLDRAALEQMVH